jgi:hypothetical protein
VETRRLTGWSSWWARVVRQEGTAVKLDKLSMCRQEAQLKKRSFVEKFFPLINKKSDKETADTMTQQLGRQYQMDTRRNVSNNINGRSSTPKRKCLSAENSFKGQIFPVAVIIHLTLTSQL